MRAALAACDATLAAMEAALDGIELTDLEVSVRASPIFAASLVTAAAGAGEHEATGDAVAFGDLVDDVEGQVVEQRGYSAVERSTPSRPWYSRLPT